MRSCLVVSLLFLVAVPAIASAEEGITSDRLKISAKLTLAEKFYDNVYWESADPSSDFVTTVSPTVGAAFGLFEGGSLKLDYTGAFSAYSRSDNFGKDNHRVGLDGIWRAPGESRFSIGASAKYDSIQPWSAQDTFKPYTDTEAHAEILLKTGTYTDLGFAYSHKTISYQDKLYSQDEYTRQAVSASILYKRFNPNILYIGYTFLDLDNNDSPEVATGWQSHQLEVGLRWEPTFKLSGKLQGGYSLTRYEDSEQISDLIVDTDLTYRMSEVLSLKIVGARQQGVSTSAAREFGDYYISTAGRFYAEYSAWESLEVTMGVTYENRTFSQEGSSASERQTKKPLGAGLSVKYTPREWFSITLGYWHSQTTATLAADEHVEDIVDLKLTFAL